MTSPSPDYCLSCVVLLYLCGMANLFGDYALEAADDYEDIRNDASDNVWYGVLWLLGLC